MEQVIDSIGPIGHYQEIVFCGFGEPLIRLQEVLEISHYVKEGGGLVRINTNGQANLIHGISVPPLLKDLVQRISISLNASSQEEYNRLCHPQNKEEAYPSILEFIQESKLYIKEVMLSVVYGSGVDLPKAKKKAKGLDLPLRVR